MIYRGAILIWIPNSRALKFIWKGNVYIEAVDDMYNNQIISKKLLIELQIGTIS